MDGVRESSHDFLREARRNSEPGRVGYMTRSGAFVVVAQRIVDGSENQMRRRQVCRGSQRV